MMERNGAQTGFTLIEAMLVIGIVAIIMAMAAPSLTDLYKSWTLGSESRKLFAAFLEAQGLATSTGTPHCLFLDRKNKGWKLRTNADGPSACDTADRTVKTANQGDWPAHVAFGPANGVSEAFAAPYHDSGHAAWCTGCAAGDDNCSLFFDIDGRIYDSSDDFVNGAVFMHDSTGSTSTVQALVIVGATGNVRLFATSE